MLRPLHKTVPLVLALLLACGGEDDPGTAPAEPVALVVITNVPTSPLLTGSSVQLVGVASNATGGAISNAAFTWTSSDALVASVSTSGLVTAVGAGAVTITAASGGKSATTTLDVRAGASVGPAGGVLTFLDGAVRLEVPAGSLAETVNVLVRPLADAANAPRNITRTMFEIAPENVNFLIGATLTLRYPAPHAPSGLDATSFQLYRLTNGAWRLVQGSEVATADRHVRGLIPRSGTFVIASTGVGRITITGATSDAALFAGQSLTYGAALFDADNNPLTGRTVTWTSSAPDVATVTDGRVTAVAAGNATITASSEGHSAATSVAVLARPTANWSNAYEWQTYQGNADHTGYMDVTLDPVVFTRRWSRTLTAGTPLTSVSEGGGAYYVATTGYFLGNQPFFAVDAATGATRWSKDFGGIHGVHAPTFAGGRVYLTTSGHEDSYLYAFDAATGAQRFRSAYGNQWSRYFAPVVMNGVVHMAGGYYGGIYAFDAISGAERWNGSTASYDEWTPAVRNGLVYSYTGESAPRVTAFHAGTGVVQFEIPDPNFSWNGWSMHTAPVLGAQNDLLATQAGRLVSFDLASRQLRYQVPGDFRGTVAVGNGQVYTINGGQLDVRRESDGSAVWTWAAPHGLVGDVLVTNNLVFVRSSSTTFAVDIATRRPVWSYPSGGPLMLSAQGALIIAGSEGTLTAIGVR